MGYHATQYLKFKRDLFSTQDTPQAFTNPDTSILLNDNVTNKRGEHRTDQEAGWRSCRLTSKFFGSPDIWHFDGFTPAISSFTLVREQRVFYKNISKNKYLFLSMYKNEPQLQNQKPLQGMSSPKTWGQSENGIGYESPCLQNKTTTIITCKRLRISTQAPGYVIRLTCQITVAASMVVQIQKIQISAPHLLSADHLQYAE